MQLGVIVTLVFVVSTAALMGIFFMISRRSGSAAWAGPTASSAQPARVAVVAPSARRAGLSL